MPLNRPRITRPRILIWFSIVFVCFCLSMIGSGVWAAVRIYSADKAAPTGVSACDRFLDRVLHSQYPAPPEIAGGANRILVSYKVSGDQLGDPVLSDAPASLKSLQEDQNTQRRIWNYFAAIIPSVARVPLKEYEIFTDGTGSATARTIITYTDTKKSSYESMALLVDPADFTDEQQFTGILLHEFGHMVTLDSTQMNGRIDAVFCPRYFNNSGCSEPNSYLQGFYERFWKDIFREWTAASTQSDPAQAKVDLAGFYRLHRTEYVSEYAASSPVEDIAESWMHFVLSPHPAGNAIADQKVSFFYAYPELVQLRLDIANRLCANNRLT
jgi:hypothetical protein